jgi:UDP-glucose 4-epimerase
VKVLVTGGAGFIGSHIVDKLVARGDSVVVLDDLSHGSRANLNQKALFAQMSVTDPKLDAMFAREKFDAVIHQAAQADVTRSVNEPMLDAQVNILGSLNLLECCRKHGVRRFVYGNSGGAGSGEPQYLPVDEEHPIKPLSPYGISKHTVEHYLEVYAQLHGIFFVSLRYANVYGPRQDPFGEGGVVAIFAHKLLRNEPPVIFGDGEQTRDFVYVEDVADANIIALDKCANTCLNVGTGTELSVNELFSQIKDACGSNVAAKKGPPRPGDIVRSVLSPARIAKELGWQPKTTLKDGIAKTVAHFRNEQAN